MLRISGVRMRDAGIMACRGANGIGPDAHVTFNLTVIGQAKGWVCFMRIIGWKKKKKKQRGRRKGRVEKEKNENNHEKKGKKKNKNIKN